MKFSFKLEEIKYIKIAYKGREGYIDSLKAAIKDINDKEIFACTKYRNDFDIELPQEIDFSVICNDGLYRTKTVLKSFDNSEPYAFLVLETPVGIEYQQNREYFRIPVTYNCIYKINSDNQIKEYHVKTYDISANGISIIMPEHIISENLSELVINIDGININTRVKYIRSEKLENGYKLSFSFENLSQLDRDYISQVCIKKQLEQKRNRIS